ncbi:MAG: hypothetical protein VKI63_01045 [Cyanobium sp.]|nr:hypothetical protein [Cyanobium sp.]
MPRTPAARPCPLPVLAPALLLALGCATLAGCSTRQSDELALRREFAVPWGASVVRYVASPAEPGWFGREGLRITLVFRLNPADAEAFSREAERSGRWRPLPIPTAELRHLAAIDTALAHQNRLTREPGNRQTPPRSIDNPTGEQLLQRFRASLPPLPRVGSYQIRTAGNDIVHAPKTVRSPLSRDVNDFMLAVLDQAAGTLAIRVSSSY